MLKRRPSYVARAPIRPLWAAAVLRLVELWLRWRYRDLYRGFRNAVKYHARLAFPESYREKTNWRKLFDHDPLFVEMQDKLRAKGLMRRLAPEIGIPRVIWEGTETPPPELAATLDRPAVLKAVHGCHMNARLSPEKPIDAAGLRNRARRFLAGHWGVQKYEWAYAGIAPRVFIEEWLEQADGTPAAEYKIAMLGEEVLHITAESGPEGGRRYGYYDAEWNRLPMLVGDGSAAADLPRPASLETMIEAARKIGALTDQIRIDFYEVDGQAWFGEFTVYSVSGLLPLKPREIDFEWGARWDLRRAWFFRADLAWPLRLYRAALGAAFADRARRRT